MTCIIAGLIQRWRNHVPVLRLLDDTKIDDFASATQHDIFNFDFNIDID